MITRKALVLAYLTARKGQWVNGPELASPEVGGSEGLKRFRELRAEGYPVEERRHPDPRRAVWQYRLVEKPMPKLVVLPGQVPAFFTEPPVKTTIPVRAGTQLDPAWTHQINPSAWWDEHLRLFQTTNVSYVQAVPDIRSDSDLIGVAAADLASVMEKVDWIEAITGGMALQVTMKKLVAIGYGSSGYIYLHRREWKELDDTVSPRRSPTGVGATVPDQPHADADPGEAG